MRTVTALALVASFPCVVACHRSSAPLSSDKPPYVTLPTTNHGDALWDADVDLVVTAEGVHVAPNGPVYPVHLETPADAATPARPVLVPDLESLIGPGKPKSARLFIDAHTPYGVVASTLYTLGDLGIRKRCLVVDVHGAPACLVPAASTKGATVAAIVRDYGVVVASATDKYDATCSAKPGVASARTTTGYDWDALAAAGRCAHDSLEKTKMLPAALSVSAAFDVPFSVVLRVVDAFDGADGAPLFGTPQLAVWNGPDP